MKMLVINIIDDVFQIQNHSELSLIISRKIKGNRKYIDVSVIKANQFVIIDPPVDITTMQFRFE